MLYKENTLYLFSILNLKVLLSSGTFSESKGSVRRKMLCIAQIINVTADNLLAKYAWHTN